MSLVSKACSLLLPFVVVVYIVPRPAVAIGVALAKWDSVNCGFGMKAGLLATGLLWASVLVTIAVSASTIVCHPKHARKRLKRSIADHIRLVGCAIIVWLACCVAAWIVLLLAVLDAGDNCDAVLYRVALGEVLSLPAFLVVVLPAAYLHSHSVMSNAGYADSASFGARGAIGASRAGALPGRGRRRATAAANEQGSDEVDGFLEQPSLGSLAANFPQMDTRIEVVDDIDV